MLAARITLPHFSVSSAISFHPATIRHVNQVDPGHHLEKLASNMAGSSDAGRSQIDLARVRLGIGSELGNCFGRNVDSPP
jgi:hypothetical protein